MPDDHDGFRDALASVKTDGRRRWIYARQPAGPFYRARTVVSWILLGVLFAAPFVRIGGQPLILMNVIDRRFVFFGVVFWPQDFYLVAILALTGLVTLMLATVTIGRVWCGWFCPQTIFMEMLFRKLEYLIDGSAEQQLRRDRAREAGARLGVRDVARRVLKQVLFFALSFAIANLFLSYIIGTDALTAIMTDPPQRHLIGLTAITIFSLLFYGVFARFREQACTFACPYGRVMSALQDARTVMVTYDWRRGEPRSRVTAAAGATAGDCVDCGKCVTVCPTGIDIRNGIQLECVNCTACIDACDAVMQRVHRPTGLIRLTSHDAVRTGRSTWLTARVKAYAAVWTALAGLLLILLARWPDIDVLILRQPGTLAAAVGADEVANFYNVQVINRTRRAQHLEYRVTSPVDARVTPLGPIGLARPQELVDSRLLLTMPTRGLTGPATPIVFEVRAEGRVVDTIRSSFIDPRGGSTASNGITP